MALIEAFAWIILLFPLMAFGIQMTLGAYLPRKGDWVSTGAISTSLLFSLLLFFRVVILEFDAHFIFPESISYYPWFNVGDLNFGFGFHIDNLTCVMLIVVTLVSTLVHFFSIGYMAHEPYYHRYFAYLSLFSFSMLLLILCDNIFMLYITWELVGVSSYLLIGFFFWKDSAANACKKAFLTTRVGDIFMFVGIMLIVMHIGHLNYREIFQAVGEGEMSGGLLSLTALCLLGGAIGKSAQFPLHVWLPDAMEGPTPVSALIHAATMVAAGVYLVARLFPIFMGSDPAMLTIAYIGLITAFFAATIAITQTDIKRVLAYSTLSQLGYMFAALGVGAYTAAIYHLMTHAFFKALLFLGSGSVIHSVHSQEMPEMGGLRKKMPITFATMLIGTLAISGVPLFSGFGSKDAILAGALQYGVDHPTHLGIFIGLLFGAGITAFYMFRLLFLTFFGEPRVQEKYDHAHESPAVMTNPLIILAVLSVIGGFGVYGTLWFDKMIVPPVIEHAHAEAHAGDHYGGHGEHHHDPLIHYGAMALSVTFAALGILFAYLVYGIRFISAELMAKILTPFYWLSYNKYFVDELYKYTVVAFVLGIRKVCSAFDRIVVDGLVNATAPVTRGTSAVSGGIDRVVVDGTVNLIALLVQIVGAISTLAQSGMIQNYLWKVGFALVVILLIHTVVLQYWL